MKKRFLIISLVLMTALVSVCAVSALHFDEFGADLKIPRGYDFENTTVVTNMFASEDGVENCYVKGDDVVTITVIPLKPSTSIDDLEQKLPDEFERKTFNGVDGYIREDPDSVTFAYIDHGNEIDLTAKDLDMIKEIMNK